MASTNDDLSLRLDRIERDVRELSQAVARPGRPSRRDLVNNLSFLGWLKISGPTFAVMVFGFGLLWTAQQANTEQLMGMNRTIGRLDGTISGLDKRVEALDTRIQQLDSRMQQLDTRLDQLGQSIDRLAQRIERLES